ncbi:MAG: flagellin [Caulobacteraceae bacterium]|nr:flagellin [Caulobacter sp.]RYF95749.1 MAG: flagellin [Caulobacteraceae bacterium]
MTRVSTSHGYSVVLSNLMRAGANQEEAQNQVSSGRAADSLRGFAPQVEQLIAANSVMARVEGYLDQGKLIVSRLEAQDLALRETANSALGARGTLAEALASDRGDAIMGELQGHFLTAAEALNAQQGGRYLFAGAQVNTRPVEASRLSDLTAVADVSDLFVNDALKPVSRLDDNITIQSGFLADEEGTELFQAFKEVQAYVEANGAFSSPLTSAQKTFIEGMLPKFDAANKSLTDTASLNGANQVRVDNSLAQHEDRSTLLKGEIKDIAEVDMAEAISRLEQAQTALQASAQVFTTLRGSSLLELLRT